MKFDKFGAFPNTGFKNEPQKANPDLFSSLFKLLPNLFNQKNSEPKNETNLPQNTNVNPTYSANAKAYAEYVAKHDAFVSKSRKNTD